MTDIATELIPCVNEVKSEGSDLLQKFHFEVLDKNVFQNKWI